MRFIMKKSLHHSKKPALLTKSKNSKQRSISLPQFQLPVNLQDAANKIQKLDLSLAQSLHQHAYKYGVYFSWVKKQVGHGKFLPWIKDNTQWSHKTVRNYCKFAEACVSAGRLLTYRPSGEPRGKPSRHPESKTEIISILDNASPRNLEDADLVEADTPTPAVDRLLEVKANEPAWKWSSPWAIERLLRAFVRVTYQCSVEEKRNVLKGIEDEIQEYIDGEEKADQMLKNLGLNAPPPDPMTFEQMKDEATRTASFERIRKSAKRVSREAAFEEFT